MSNSDHHVSVGQAISWVISAAVFFAGITFALIGRTNEQAIAETKQAIEKTDEALRLQYERIRKLETIVEVQQVQYLNIMAAIAELKVAVKEISAKR